MCGQCSTKVLHLWAKNKLGALQLVLSKLIQIHGLAIFKVFNTTCNVSIGNKTQRHLNFKSVRNLHEWLSEGRKSEYCEQKYKLNRSKLCTRRLKSVYQKFSKMFCCTELNCKHIQWELQRLFRCNPPNFITKQ